MTKILISCLIFPTLPFPFYTLYDVFTSVCFGKGGSLHAAFRPHSAAQQWATNLEHSLPRNKESSHPVLNLSPCLGLSSPDSDPRYTPLLCLSMCARRHLGRRWGLSAEAQKGSVALCQLLGRTC